MGLVNGEGPGKYEVSISARRCQTDEHGDSDELVR